MIDLGVAHVSLPDQISFKSNSNENKEFLYMVQRTYLDRSCFFKIGCITCATLASSTMYEYL